jgi:TIGR03009 family protein
MRSFGFLVGLIFLFATAVNAQQGNQPSQPAPVRMDPKDPLDAVLMQWENKMTGITSLSAEVKRQRIDNVFKTSDLFVGSASYLKPNMAILDLHREKNASQFEKFICTGQYLYEYSPTQKQIRVHPMPTDKNGKMADDNFLSFLLGMKAIDAKQRYDLKLLPEDANYIYLQVKPRTNEDHSEFSKAILALTKSTFMPRGLQFTEPNNNVIIWDIPSLQINAAIPKTAFATPTPPPGWSMVSAPQQPRVSLDKGQNPPPRVIRPNGQQP